MRWLNTVSLELLYSNLSLLVLQYYIAFLLFNFLQVTYCAAGFVDKNNDLLFRDLSQCMYACGHPLAQALFPEGKSDYGFVLLDSTVSKPVYVSRTFDMWLDIFEGEYH